MSRIKLKELLKNFVTEQAPQPPPEQAAAPAPPQSQPAGGLPTAPEPNVPAPTGDAAPPPESSGEYDFTKDFKVFESTIEKAKQQAKKKFLDRLNQFVKDKKVTVNASRGYGQPQKDYTIEKVSKGSVDWYYNKNVVVLTDENGKEYFLTPGVNIKIEQAAPAEPEAPAEKPQDQAPQEPPKMKQPEPPAEQPAPTAEPGSPGAEAPKEPAVAPATPEQQPGQPQTPPEDQQAQLKKKKKPAPAMAEEEVVTEDTKPLKAEDVASMNDLFGAFVPENRRDRFGRFDVRPYFKSGKSDGDSESWSTEYRIEIPMEVFDNRLDMREFKLEAKDYMRHYQGPGGEFSRGGVEVTQHGKFYVFDFYESGGLDI